MISKSIDPHGNFVGFFSQNKPSLFAISRNCVTKRDGFIPTIVCLVIGRKMYETGAEIC